MSQLDFRLPDIGEGVHEGEVVRWIVPEGATVAADDLVVEVMTDKATVEIPSPAAGVIAKHLYAEGDIAEVGEILFVITTDGEAVDTASPAVEATSAVGATAVATVAAVPVATGGKVLAAPATRRLAREMNVDLSLIAGTGPNGRIRPDDVRAGVQIAGSGVGAPSAVAGSVPVAGSREVDRIPFRGIRRKTAEAMSRSKFTATHFSLIEEVDCTQLVISRNGVKAVGEEQGVKVTYMAYIMKATAKALMEFSQLNAELDEEAQEIIIKKYVNLGVAVDTPNGLVVPVVHDVQAKGLLQIASDLVDIATRARDGKLTPADFKDTTFTISNAGNIGGVLATPIINFPEVAIMGVHSMRKMPRCVGNDIVARDVMNLSISIDHRIVDGADGARFMVRVRDLLENPTLMLI